MDLHCYGQKFREKQLTAMRPSSIASASLTADRSIAHFCAVPPGAVYKACDAVDMVKHPAVGLVGLGLMGSALADRLLGANQRVLGWDIDAECRAALREREGDVARDAQEVFSSCSRVLLSLPSHREVGDVVQAAGPSLCRGLTIIDTTTGDPASTRGAGESPE